MMIKYPFKQKKIYIFKKVQKIMEIKKDKE